MTNKIIELVLEIIAIQLIVFLVNSFFRISDSTNLYLIIFILGSSLAIAFTHISIALPGESVLGKSLQIIFPFIACLVISIGMLLIAQISEAVASDFGDKRLIVARVIDCLFFILVCCLIFKFYYKVETVLPLQIVPFLILWILGIVAVLYFVSAETSKPSIIGFFTAGYFLCYFGRSFNLIR